MLYVVEASSFALAFCTTFNPRSRSSRTSRRITSTGTARSSTTATARRRSPRSRRPDDLFLFPAAQPDRRSRSDRTVRAGKHSRPTDDSSTAFVRSRATFRRTTPMPRLRAAAFVRGRTRMRSSERADSYQFDDHRLGRSGGSDGVRVYDDSVSTNPHATLAALRTVRRSRRSDRRRPQQGIDSALWLTNPKG